MALLNVFVNQLFVKVFCVINIFRLFIYYFASFYGPYIRMYFVGLKDKVDQINLTYYY